MFRNFTFVGMAISAIVLLSALVLNHNGIRDFLYGITGEESTEHQVRGLANWVLGVTRPQPQTDDFVPIAYNGVNPLTRWLATLATSSHRQATVVSAAGEMRRRGATRWASHAVPTIAAAIKIGTNSAG